jgi:hypothetical protein
MGRFDILTIGCSFSLLLSPTLQSQKAIAGQMRDQTDESFVLLINLYVANLKWESFVDFANTSEYGRVGQIKARYIKLPLIKASMSKSKVTLHSNLYSRVQDLNDGSSDGLACAKAMFCSKGKLKKELISNGEYSLGPWGTELENGAVLILQLVFIEREFGQKGVGKLLLQSLISRCKETTGRTEKGQIKFVIVYPAVVKEDFEKELEGKTQAEKKLRKSIIK